MPVDAFLLSLLACPYDGGTLSLAGELLHCECGRTYPIVDGIPVLLRNDVEQTHAEAARSLSIAESGGSMVGEVIEATRGEAAGAVRPDQGEVDQHVQYWVSATNGVMYKNLVGRLTEYPIPNLDLPVGRGKLFLDIGCNWARWCVAAARRGYRPIGIDPSLQALQAARRVSKQMGVESQFVCGDGRYLPFKAFAFDVVFSYSVLQHFAKSDVAMSLREANRVLKQSGRVVIQMPNAFGLRSLYHQLRRGFHEGRDFDVRYWTPGELRARFSEIIGPTRISADGFFSLNPQASEKHLLPARYRAVVTVSDALRAVSHTVGALTYLADSLIITSEKPGADAPRPA